MAVEFTREQKMAIESRDCSLIVSAAAGSGKTAVLVERVIGLLTDPVEPCNVDELSRIVAMSFCEPRSCTKQLSS